jgi:transcriptional regulator with XRE-family HTH domain
MARPYPFLGELQPKNLCGTPHRIFGKVPPMAGIDSKAFGRRVRIRREEFGWSQGKLGDLTGYSQQQIGFIEDGGLKRPERAAPTLSNALETTEERLLHGTGTKDAPPPIMSLGEVVDNYGPLDAAGRRQVSELLRRLSGSKRKPR